MHQERSVLGCLLLLHRILFVFGRAMRPGCQVTSVVHRKNPKTLQTRVLSVCPDETFPKYRKKLDFYKKTTETTKSGMKYLRSVSKCHCLIPTSSSATRAHSSETWLIINTFPRSICMSFTKYVGVVEIPPLWACYQRVSLYNQLIAIACTQSWSETIIAEVSR